MIEVDYKSRSKSSAEISSQRVASLETLPRPKIRDELRLDVARYVPSLVKTTGLPWVFPIETREDRSDGEDQHAGREVEQCAEMEVSAMMMPSFVPEHG